jgi:hypothetical protein
LLIGKSTEGIISKKELNALNRIIAGGPLFDAPVKISKQPPKTNKVTAAEKKGQKAKIKTTHYLTQDVCENLDKAQIAIRSYVSENLQSRISKSHIVNQALALILHEIETKGKNCRLVHTIIQKT